MNRRTFLSALGAVATQQKFVKLNLEPPLDCEIPVPTVTVTRFPYLQNARTDRVSVLWGTLEPGIGQVAYSSDGVNYQLVNAKSTFFSRTTTQLAYNYWQYQADLTGLTPSTDYIYRVSVDGIDVGAAGETRFRTAGPGPFNFVVLGDSGWGQLPNDGQGLIAQRVNVERPALVIHTGDLVYNPSGTFDSYQRNYFNYFAPGMCAVPFFPCPGNHDYEVPNAMPYLAIHSVPTDGVPVQDRGRYYSFDWGNVHFVSIDAHQSLERAVNANGPMLRWLDNDLRSTRQFWRIVYFHYPPWATGQNVNDPQCTWARQFMVPIFDNNGVQIVFSGHEHSYQRTVPIRRGSQVPVGVGTSYFTSGGGGAILYDVPDKPMVAFARKTYHYIRAEVQGTRIVIHSVRQDGVEIDSYAIAPTPVFSDDPKAPPVTLTPAPVAGAFIRINGRGLASEETFLCTPSPATTLGGVVVTVNGIAIQLLYVSPTQIYGQLPIAIDGNLTVRITTGNGSVERSL